MLRRSLVPLVLVLALASCSSEPTPPPARPVSMPREVTPRSKLPVVIQPLVPKHGVYAAGGGLRSSAWRVVIDTDAKTIYGGFTKTANSKPYAKLDDEHTRELTPPNERQLMGLANDAWNEPPPSQPPEPLADYEEILIVVDGDDCFFLDSFGPTKRPAAAKAIEMLRAAAGLP